jgi:hypothetical protein
MIIDLVKIGKIKSKKDLNEYPINQPFFYNNYLFHYLIITNNLNGLKLVEFPIYKFNEDNYNGFMLAAKYNYYNILNHLLIKYSRYINKKNDFNEIFLHHLDPYVDNYIQFIIDNKNKLTKLFYIYNDDEICPLDMLFSRGSFESIIKINHALNFNYGDYLKTPSFFNMLLNENINSKEIIQICQLLFKKDNKIFSYVDNDGNNILYPIVMKGKLKLLKYFYDLNNNDDVIKFDYYTPINTYHIFSLAYSKGLIDNNYEMADFILDKIIDKHNFDETDKEGNNLAHFILNSRLSHNDGNYKIEKKILNKYNDWHKNNIHKISPFDLILKLDGKKYGKFIKNITLNKRIRKIPKSWKGIIKKLKVNKDKSKNHKKIILLDNKYTHGNIFQAKFTDIALFLMYLGDKYNNLYIPLWKGKYNHEIDENIYLPDTWLSEYNNFPWLIIWNNKKNYFIHPHLNKLIKKNKKYYDYGVVILSLRLPSGGLHAALVLYDFKRNIIERFDPYGNTSLLDINMDKFLGKELVLNTGMTYYNPGIYFPVAGFQTLSNEDDIYNQKMGDFGGYCLAWTLWYIEHRLLNNKINPKKLIRKTINKFMGMKIKPMEYIRNYANNINKYRVDLMIDAGIPENIVSNEVFNNACYDKLNKFIIKYHQ